MHNPNDWKAGPEGSVVAGNETICRHVTAANRPLVLAAPTMHEFLTGLADGDNPFADYAGRLVALAEGRGAATLLPYQDTFDIETEDDEEVIRV